MWGAEEEGRRSATSGDERGATSWRFPSGRPTIYSQQVDALFRILLIEDGQVKHLNVRVVWYNRVLVSDFISVEEILRGETLSIQHQVLRGGLAAARALPGMRGWFLKVLGNLYASQLFSSKVLRNLIYNYISEHRKSGHWVIAVLNKLWRGTLTNLDNYFRGYEETISAESSSGTTEEIHPDSLDIRSTRFAKNMLATFLHGDVDVEALEFASDDSTQGQYFTPTLLLPGFRVCPPAF